MEIEKMPLVEIQAHFLDWSIRQVTRVNAELNSNPIQFRLCVESY